MPRNWRLDIGKSVRLCKFWCELLVLSEGDLQWRFFTVSQDSLTELGTRYALQELCQIPHPYSGSRYNLETIVRTIDTYLSREASRRDWEIGLGPLYLQKTPWTRLVQV